MVGLGVVGVAASDRPLVLSDAFAPSGAVELDLSGRGFVEVLLEPARWARHAEVKIGLPPASTKPHRTCVDFRIDRGSGARA
jgi:hypothetical protein